MAEQKADRPEWRAKNPYIAILEYVYKLEEDGWVLLDMIPDTMLEKAAFDEGCVAQAKALIAAIEKHFWKAWDGSPYLLSFGEETKHTCISLDWDWWQQLKQEVERG